MISLPTSVLVMFPRPVAAVSQSKYLSGLTPKLPAEVTQGLLCLPVPARRLSRGSVQGFGVACLESAPSVVALLLITAPSTGLTCRLSQGQAAGRASLGDTGKVSFVLVSQSVEAVLCMLMNNEMD